jgi:hypothetical protein
MSVQTPTGVVNGENADNFEDIEKQFAVKGEFARSPKKMTCSNTLLSCAVVQHMTTYWSILEKVPGSKLRLTKVDDDIHEHFLKDFPDYDLKATINEDEMKSKAGKERWRTFINSYEGKVDDYNFGTMLRANAAEEYGQEGTIFGRPRR